MSITRSLSVASLLGAIASLCLTACEPVASGPSVTESRSVETFHAIELRGSAELDIEVGPAPSLSLTGDAAAIAGMKTSVEGGSLVLERKGRWFWHQGSGPVKLHITVPKLDSLVLNGTGLSSITGVTGGDLDLLVQGTGNVKAVGQVDKLTARINGTGNMDLTLLTAAAATASVNGAGSLTVFATGSLDAEVNGVGSIAYLGHPAKVESSIHGVGNIAPK